MTQAEGPPLARDIKVLCAECGQVATRVQLVPPEERAKPIDWESWGRAERERFAKYNDPSRWRMIYNGIEAGNGSGDDIDEDLARQISRAFSEPLTYASVRTADLYDDAGFCARCGVAYCYTHWKTSTTGDGNCPKGHGKSLDPHWSPDS